MNSPPTDPAESILARFLAEHTARDGALFASWARKQPELVGDAALLARVEKLRAQVERDGALLGGSPSDTRGGFFGRGAARRRTDAEEADDSSPGASFTAGQRVGTFTLRRFLAKGGMGHVWEAYDEELRRPVALKFVRPDHVNVRSLELFEREARAGGRLNHPSIVRTLAFSGSSDPVWIAQELVEGSWTLKDFLAELRNEETTPDGYYRKAAELVAALADGIEAAHRAGVIHRDIKPQNILIAPDDSPKLTDFGLARVVDDSFASVTGTVAGTYEYMSPEQVTAKLIGLDHRTDIFSLGVVLYEMLSLRRPFEGDSGPQISQKILFFDPPEPSKVRSQCPRELSIICGKALEKEPDRRYATMAEFAADLRRHLADEPIHARPPGTLVRVWKWSRRNPVTSLSSVAGIVTVTATTAFWVQSTAMEKLDRLASDLAISNRALEQSNVELAAQIERAELGEREARKNADHAQQNAELAQRNEAESKRSQMIAQLARDEAQEIAGEVLALSSQLDHDQLVVEAAKLWPAHPETISAYEEWLRRANELILGRPADESRGLKKRPSLAEHASKVDELERSATRPIEADVRAEREPHATLAELQAMQVQLLTYSRMLGDDAWPSEASVAAGLSTRDLPTDAEALNALAWPLVDTSSYENTVFGQEVRALLLARRALAASSEGARSRVRATLAWALFRVARFDEARGEMRTALSEPGGEALKSTADALEDVLAYWSGDNMAEHRKRRDKLAEEVAALSALVRNRRPFEFDDPEKKWWNRQLVKLVSDLDALSDPRTGLMNDVLAEPFGWGVAKRYEFARSIGERSVSGSDATRLWSEAIAAIESSPKYGGLKMVPQMGLLPIGMDPNSGLWEFAHLQTGEPAFRDAYGRLELTEATGLVLVLIPGAKFLMGAQNDPGAANHDPQARNNADRLGDRDNEGPVREVELSAYFLSKYEMTQGQWQRIAATNPSYYKPPGGIAPSLLHPVEQVSWAMCFDLLERLGLSLPSEAQWEFGARGGTSTAWWTGQERESLRGKVNIADQTAKNAGALWSSIDDWPGLEDGSAVHCAVGKYAANGFGLHEVVGNVSEWCLDGYDSGFSGAASGNDPQSPGVDASRRVFRGGGFNDAAALVRAASRVSSPPEYRTSSLGVRPASALRH